MSNEDRYVFQADWYDQQSSLMRKFYISYYPADQTLEIVSEASIRIICKLIQYDLKNKRAFLKRMKYPAVSEEDLFVGATITVYSRQYKLTDYGDEFTKKAFDQQYHLEKTFAMIKPEQYVNMGKIIQVIEQSGFRISNLRMLKLSPYETQEFFTNSGMKFIGQDVIQYISSDMVIGLELVRENAISVL